CHSAAGGVQDSCLCAGHTFGQPRHERRVENRFRMAMRMDGYPATAGLALEPKCLRFLLQQIVHEFLEQKTACGDVFGVVNFQLAVIFDEHRPAGGLEEENWSGRKLIVDS